jgi:hypothetical protein
MMAAGVGFANSGSKTLGAVLLVGGVIYIIAFKIYQHRKS